MTVIPSFNQAIRASTCQKRITVVELFAEDGRILSRGSNRCAPSGGVCHRLGVVQDKDNYDVINSCNWTHAEIITIEQLPEGSKPYRAVLFGHSFYCDACVSALRAVGVEVFEIQETELHQLKPSKN